eukprot:288108-Alexandrium_andersonii.AAC.1
MRRNPSLASALRPLSLRAPAWSFAFMARRRVVGESRGAKAMELPPRPNPQAPIRHLRMLLQMSIWMLLDSTSPACCSAPPFTRTSKSAGSQSL